MHCARHPGWVSLCHHGGEHKGGQLRKPLVAAGLITFADHRIHAGFLGFLGCLGDVIFGELACLLGEFLGLLGELVLGGGLGDLLVRHSLGDQLQNLCLATGGGG